MKSFRRRMPLRHVFLLSSLVGVLLAAPAAHAQNGLDSVDDIEAALEALQLMTPATLKALKAANDTIGDACTPDTLARIQAALDGFREVVGQERNVRAKASFSIEDNQASGRDLPEAATDREKQTVKAAIELSRGRYPLEVDLRSSVSLIRTEQQVIQENISRLFLSVDRHFNDPRLEAFGFVNRTTDGFLSIDQRYETGGGVVLNLWLGHTSIGQERIEKVTHGRTSATPNAYLPAPNDASPPPLFAASSEWVDCYETVLSVTEGKPTTIRKTTLDALQQAAEVAAASLVKAHYRVRLALLVGVLGEIEQATIHENVSVNDRGWRFEIRPTLAWQPLEDLSFRGQWYFKFGLFGFRDPPAAFEDAIRREIVGGGDVRSELSLTTSLRVKGVELVLQHVQLRDAIPPFAIVGDEVFVAAWKRNFTTFNVTIPL